MELILRWDVCDQVVGEMKDIIYKCYRYLVLFVIGPGRARFVSRLSDSV